MRRIAMSAAAALALTAACSSAPPHPQSPAPQAGLTPQMPVAGLAPEAVQGPAPEAACAEATAPLAALPQRTPDEPLLEVPTPTGWRFTTEKNSDRIRGVIFNPTLKSGGFVTNAIVTLTDVTGDVSNVKQALGTEAGATPDGETTCGFPSKTVTYDAGGQHGTSLVVAAQDAHARIWVATVHIRTADPTNPIYVADSRAIVDGFQIAPAGQR